MFIVPFSGRLSTHPIVFNLSHNIDKYGVIVIARYLVGLLDHRSPSFFERYQPVSFSTAATPVSRLVQLVHLLCFLLCCIFKDLLIVFLRNAY